MTPTEKGAGIPIGFGYHVTTADTAREAKSGTPQILAITGLAIWAIQTYLINPAPMAVVVAMWTLIPALVGWLSTHVTVRKITI